MPNSFLLSRALPLTLSAGLLAGGVARPATAQTSAPDSTRLSYAEEAVAAPPPPDTLLRVQREDRSLWKVSLTDFTTSANRTSSGQFYTRFGLPVAYERRVGESAWSVLAEANPGLVRYRPEASRPLRRGVEVYTQLAGRYYYNIDRRRRLGHNTTHFSANYLSAALGSRVGLRRDFADFRVLYGLQRRLGRYGFLDFNFGPGTQFTQRKPALYPTTDLRIGLALSSWPAAPYRARLSRPGEDQSLQPRAYAGLHVGAYAYQVRYSSLSPYRTQSLSSPNENTNGVGTYDLLYNRPSAYAGYYLRPRLAVQVGVQQAHNTTSRSTIDFRGQSKGTVREQGLALPVLVRYSLTGAFLKRLQFDAVGGLVPAWSWVRYQEQLPGSGQPASTPDFKRRDSGLHATGGFNVGYGFGRRRRVQAVWETMFTRGLRGTAEADGKEQQLQAGVSLGLRYRFAYQ